MNFEQVKDENIFSKYGNIDNCPVRNVLDRIGDKWSILVLLILDETGTRRFNEIRSIIGEISQKMLSATVKKLEADSLITKKIYPEVPPRTEYTITGRGKELMPILHQLAGWAYRNLEPIKESRRAFISVN